MRFKKPAPLPTKKDADDAYALLQGIDAEAQAANAYSGLKGSGAFLSKHSSDANRALGILRTLRREPPPFVVAHSGTLTACGWWIR